MGSPEAPIRTSSPTKRPSFSLCKTFSGKDSQSATKWLRMYEYELSETLPSGQAIPPDMYVKYLDFLLVEDAEIWAEATPEVQEILTKKPPTKNDVELFKELFNDQFPPVHAEPIVFDFNAELSELRQGETESLSAYYKRTHALLKRSGGHDRAPNVTVSSVESIVLTITIKAFLRGIYDPDVRQETIKKPITKESSLASTYEYADSVRRSRVEQEKWFEEGLKEKENSWMKSLILQHVPATQFESLRANAISSLPYAPRHTPVNAPMPYSAPPAHYQPPQAMQAQTGPYFNAAEPPYQPQYAQQQPQPAYTGYQRQPYEGQPRAQYNDSRRNENYGYGRGQQQRRQQNSNGNTGAFPDRTESANEFVNGSTVYSRDMGFLCIDCGKIGHTPRDGNCPNRQLAGWERYWLRNVLFAVLPPRQESRIHEHPSSRPASPPAPNSAPAANSISFGTTEVRHTEANAIDVMAGEGSRPNKRLATTVDDEPEEPAIHPGIVLNPVIPLVATEPKQKMKTKRRAKGEPKALLPLQGMLDEHTGQLQPVSIRHIVRSNKINVSLMELCSISPLFCREFKKLMTRVPGKKKAKAAPIVDITMGGTQSQTQLGNAVSAVQYDINTQFLHSLGTHDKAFRIPCSVRVAKNGQSTDVPLEKSQTQADQGSDMNVASTPLIRKLGLPFNTLASIGFAGMTMRTADHVETKLFHWTEMTINVAGIWRTIRVFIAPEKSAVPIPAMSLLLGIPWLYSVNAVISIRNSSIQVGDPTIGETVREVVGPELVFHKDHNLLMYPRHLLSTTNTGKAQKAAELNRLGDWNEKEDSSSDSEESEEEDDDESIELEDLEPNVSNIRLSDFQ